jgi:hypothetical protein
LGNDFGVLWLWPGKLGTVVKKKNTLSIDRNIDKVVRPNLERRILKYWGRDEEVFDWVDSHMLGSRSDFKFGHAFRDWWNKYHESFPEYFAVPPQEFNQPWPNSKQVKLNIGNPSVESQILMEWIEAGKPNNWNVAPNDGIGWCTSAESRKLDPLDYNIISSKDIWLGKENLTQRYFSFWNSLLRKMELINPDITLSINAYGVLRDFPTDITPPSNLVVSVVNSYNSYESWIKWEGAGAKLMLRPNWWHVGGCAPHLPLHKAGNFFKFAYRHGMIGFYFDSLLGYWGCQGVYYYLIARLSENPNLAVDNIIGEFCSGFGNAAPEIKRYISYWENFTTKAAYPIPAGGIVSIDIEGLYVKAVQKHNLPLHPIKGSWTIIPYLYTDEVLAPAFNILDQAYVLAKRDDKEVLERINYLYNGLVYLRNIRNYLIDGDTATNRKNIILGNVKQNKVKLKWDWKGVPDKHIVSDEYVIRQLKKMKIIKNQ